MYLLWVQNYQTTFGFWRRKQGWFVFPRLNPSGVAMRHRSQTQLILFDIPHLFDMSLLSLLLSDMPRPWSGPLLCRWVWRQQLDSDLNLRLGRHYPAPGLQIEEIGWGPIRLCVCFRFIQMSFCFRDSLDKGKLWVPILGFKGFPCRSDWFERDVFRIILSTDEDEWEKARHGGNT